MRFVLKRSWKGRAVKNRRQGIGANIKSMAEIDALTKKIKEKEAQELAAQEALIDAELQKL